jgi:SAM-dependent methyltransferase
MKKLFFAILSLFVCASADSLKPSLSEMARRNLKMDKAMLANILAKYQMHDWFRDQVTQRWKRWESWQTCDYIHKNLPKTAAILDTGCGTGFNSFWLAEQGFTKLDGFDIDKNVLDAGNEIAARSGLPVKMWQADGLKAQQFPRKYDAILFINWIFLVPIDSFTDFLALYAPALNDGGLMFLNVLDSSYNDTENNEYRSDDWDKPIAQRRPSQYAFRVSAKEVRDACKANGMTVVSVLKSADNEVIPKLVYVARKN